ncbi:VacJ family lipoprotein [Qipengyuania sp. ASV99]|uniref:MlaA family lipoprotein n=1 Tax=Qipengyuania sp. ASV99 TaxID=3399681 RepID=UPI003A4C579F
MPLASLLVLTSPLLLSPAVPAGSAALGVSSPAVVAVAAAPVAEADLVVLPLVWSLSAQQSQDPPEGTGPEEDAPQPPAQNEIIVEGEYGPTEGDPVGEFNETSYRITQDLDQAFVEPIAYAYRDGLPDPVRDGLGNVVRNLGEPANILNFLLQGKFGKAAETLGRLAINSTLGVGGLVDIAAKPGIGLPYRRNGFANTMGFYGVGSGAYLYLPLTGATSVRDLIGSTLDQAVLPVAVGAPFNRIEYAAPYFVINSLDARLEVDEELARIGETVDPYAARRDSYLYRRERDIALLKGEEPAEPPAILEEVEGTGEFGEPGDTADEPKVSALNITRPR